MVDDAPGGLSQKLAEQAAAALGRAGFDLVQPFRADLHGRADPTALGLPAALRPDGLALLIGASRSLWPAFAAAVTMDPPLAATDEPFDHWIEKTIDSTLGSLGVRVQLRFAHDPPPRLAIQRLAVLAGLAPLGPAALVAHPNFGPWISLRAVALLDAPGPAVPALPQLQPCAGCAAPCKTALDEALGGRPLAEAGFGGDWPRWLGVRDACPIGRDWRYSEAQIRYHYDPTARAGVLHELVEAAGLLVRQKNKPAD